jgi:PAS domain-containing protein
LADNPITYRQSNERPAQMPVEAAVRWMADLATQGILMTDRDLNIRSWNRWLEANTGLPASKMLGQNLLEAFPDVATRGLDSYYRDALNGQVRVLSQKFHRYLLRMAVPDSLSGNMEQSVRVGPLIHESAVVGTVTVIDDGGAATYHRYPGEHHGFLLFARSRLAFHRHQPICRRRYFWPAKRESDWEGLLGRIPASN